jgi:hypothetical protein
MLRARVKNLEVIVTMPAIFEWLALSLIKAMAYLSAG